MKREKQFCPDKIGDYFRIEWLPLVLVTVSGLIYNIGLLAAPWFEGRLAQCLADILGGNAAASAMAMLVLAYILVTLLVQAARFIKRFYVRRFANNINRRMKGILYANLVRQSRAALEKEGAGELMTKAISDVDDCVEGMRKFTTEIFDTGVALVGYAVMLLVYDWRLALLSLLFTPFSYMCAAWMKKPVQREGAAYKKAAGALRAATLDRARNAATYRNYGCETAREERYEDVLKNYERTAVRSNVWQSALPPLYLAVSEAGVLFILWFGAKNVLGTGWCAWNIAAFTTFLSCFTKLVVKSSKVAKLFNSVQKAEVSWRRIKPLMKLPEQLAPLDAQIAALKGSGSDMEAITAHASELAELAVEEDEILRSCGPLTAEDRVFLARHPERPHIDETISALFTDFFEQRGDRQCKEDAAILGGVARFHGMPVTVIGHRKGSTLEENLACNFGMPGPEGYRKALRLMKQAEKFGRPIITFIDTPGAYPGKDAEERGQGEAIARNLMEMSGLTVPVIAVVTGEGSSGGALALGVANHILMLENAVYSVLSPEGFASILWKDSSRSGEACEMMKLTAQDLYRGGIVEEVIPEPVGGAQRCHAALFERMDAALRAHLKELCRMSDRQLADQRYKKYRQIGETRNA